MEGVFTYWFGWGLWVIISFFWTKSTRRLWSAAGILIALSLMPYEIKLAGTSLPIVFLLFSLYLCWQIRLFTTIRLLLYLLASWTIGAAYGAFQLIMIFDPVIAFIDERWMSACLVAALAFVLANCLRTRFILALLGLVQGEYLLSMVMNFLHLHNEIGSLAFFDTIAIVGLLYGFGWSVKCLASWMNRTLTKDETPSLKQTS